jgi:hypothetical protein
MTSAIFALYLRRIRLTNDLEALASIRAEVDRLYPSGEDSEAIVKMVTLKRVRIQQELEKN